MGSAQFSHSFASSYLDSETTLYNHLSLSKVPLSIPSLSNPILSNTAPSLSTSSLSTPTLSTSSLFNPTLSNPSLSTTTTSLTPSTKKFTFFDDDFDNQIISELNLFSNMNSSSLSTPTLSTSPVSNSTTTLSASPPSNSTPSLSTPYLSTPSLSSSKKFSFFENDLDYVGIPSLSTPCLSTSSQSTSDGPPSVSSSSLTASSLSTSDGPQAVSSFSLSAPSLSTSCLSIPYSPSLEMLDSLSSFLSLSSLVDCISLSLSHQAYNDSTQKERMRDMSQTDDNLLEKINENQVCLELLGRSYFETRIDIMRIERRLNREKEEMEIDEIEREEIERKEIEGEDYVQNVSLNYQISS
jgi:hypothetical protein